MIDVKAGDFAVVARSWSRHVAVKVSKVTAQQIKASGEWSSRDRTYRRDDVIYAGPEDAAGRLVERLKSSQALCSDEQRKAEDRRQARDTKLIEGANAAPMKAAAGV